MEDKVILVLTRRFNEAVFIGEDIKVTLLRGQNGQIRLGIDAPKNITILREELQDRNQAGVNNSG